MEIKKGISVSPGVVISTAIVLDAEDLRIPKRVVEAAQVPVEVDRLNQAIADSVVELAHLRESVTASVGKEIGEIFAVHLSILGDRRISGEMVAEIRNQQVTAEYAVSTVMRRYAVPGAYEKLKEVTRGKSVRPEDLHALIRSLDIPQAEKDRLLAMTPASYIGKAAELAKRV